MSRKRLLQKIFFAGVLSTLSVLNVVAGGPDDVANVAERQIGVRRAEGSAATTPERGFDCSGLTLYCYRHGASIEIGRTTQDQRHKGRIVGRDGLRRGDLVFFYPGWSHVGIYAGDGKVIHSSSSAKKVVKATIWKDFVGGVKVIEHVPRPVPVPAPVPAPVQVVNHAGTAFSSTIRQRGCCKGDGHPELCVDAAAENNGKIQLWHYLGGANQKWDFVPSGTGPDEYYIISKAPWLTGGHAYLTQRNQAEVVYERGRNAREQIWKFIRTGRENFWLIKNVATGRYLDSGPHGNHRDRGDVYTNGRCEREQIWSLM